MERDDCVSTYFGAEGAIALGGSNYPIIWDWYVHSVFDRSVNDVSKTGSFIRISTPLNVPAMASAFDGSLLALGLKIFVRLIEVETHCCKI